MQTRLLTNAHFYSFNPAQPFFDTLLVREGKILFAGSLNQLEHHLSKDVITEDLQGAFVLPGFSDAHIHLLEYGFSLQRINCKTATRKECLDLLRESAKSVKTGNWILGHGWNHNVWPEGQGSREMLDECSDRHPIYLTHKSLHCAWANSAALSAAGITLETANPTDGKIQRNAAGEPTGILYESAMRLVENHIPMADEEIGISALLKAQEQLLEWGITTVHDFDTWECGKLLEKMEQAGQLKIRVIKSIPYPQLDQAILEGKKSGAGSKMLRTGWLKLFADGALGPQTAAMLEPYEKSTNTGMLFITKEEITEIGRKAMGAGISLAIHAIGDRANQEVINGYAQLEKEGYLSGIPLKPRIEHVQLITSRDVHRLAAMGITASMQPIHAVSDRDMADRHWGNRCTQAYAWKSVRNCGGMLVFGSDAPVETPNPFWGLSAAIQRTSPGNLQLRKSWFPAHCLTIQEALASYIVTPQIASGSGRFAGRLANGYAADLVVIPEQLFNINHAVVSNIKPLATMAAGEWVFRKP